MKKIYTNYKKRNNTFIIIISILLLSIFIFFYLYNKNKIQYINEKDKDGLTPIMKLLINNKDTKNSIDSKDIRKFIFENRRNIDYSIVDNNKKTLLMYATFYGDSDIIREIAKNCKDCINSVDDDGRSALHIAVYYNNINAVKTLIELGADNNLKDNYNLKAIDLAEFEGYEDIYSFLYSLK